MENRLITEHDEKTHDALVQETNRAHLLQKELEETKLEIEELQSKSFRFFVFLNLHYI